MWRAPRQPYTVAMGIADPARTIYRAYGLLLLVTGVVLIGWGPMFFGVNFTSPPPFLKASYVRTIGALIAAGGCFSIAMTKLGDSQSHRQGLFWIAAGHATVLFVLATQRIAIWQAGPADIAISILAALMILFGVFRETPHRGLRSRYETQIRQAAMQEERNRLARDLHDSVKQRIFIIQTAAATALARFENDRPGAREALDQVSASAREAMGEMDTMFDQLRAEALTGVGLVEAIRKQCDSLRFRTGARVTFVPGELPADKRLAPGAWQAMLRAAQEALMNIARHARPSKVEVTLQALRGKVELRLRDDGAGFDPNHRPGGMGLDNIRSRAAEFGGTFELDSAPGAGTTVTFTLPYSTDDPLEHRKRAIGWSIIAIFNGLLATSNFLLWTLAAVAAAASIREAAIWLRLRNS